MGSPVRRPGGKTESTRKIMAFAQIFANDNTSTNSNKMRAIRLRVVPITGIGKIALEGPTAGSDSRSGESWSKGRRMPSSLGNC